MPCHIWPPVPLGCPYPRAILSANHKLFPGIPIVQVTTRAIPALASGGWSRQGGDTQHKLNSSPSVSPCARSALPPTTQTPNKMLRVCASKDGSTGCHVDIGPWRAILIPTQDTRRLSAAGWLLMCSAGCDSREQGHFL